MMNLVNDTDKDYLSQIKCKITFFFFALFNFIINISLEHQLQEEKRPLRRWVHTIFLENEV